MKIWGVCFEFQPWVRGSEVSVSPHVRIQTGSFCRLPFGDIISCFLGSLLIMIRHLCFESWRSVVRVKSFFPVDFVINSISYVCSSFYNYNA